MITKITPHVCLSNVVDYYWTEKNGANSVKILPDGTTSILFNLGENIGIESNGASNKYLSHDLIIGANKKYYTVHHNTNSYIVGIKFKQGGAFHFFNTPMKEFSHQIINLHDVLNGESEKLRFKLLRAKNQKDITRILDHHMLLKIGYSNKSSMLVDSMINKVKISGLPSKIKDLSNTAKISHKHLITLFNQIVGLSPKLVHRLNKFTKVIDIIQEKNQINWPQIAYECHYYDQAHLINEFKSFSGISPKNYFDNEKAVGLRVIMA